MARRHVLNVMTPMIVLSAHAASFLTLTLKLVKIWVGRD